MKVIDAHVEEIVFHIPEGYQTIEAWLEKVGRTCFHPDTEVLTNSGWKPVAAVDKTDMVLTYNTSSNKLEYQNSNMVCKDFNGALVKSIHRNVNFRVTPDHRIFACKAWDSTKQYKFIEAVELIKSNRNAGWRVPKFFSGAEIEALEHPNIIKTEDYKYDSGREGHKHSTTIAGKEYQITKEFLTIMASYITEGFIGRPKGSGSYVAITQSIHEELYTMIINSLDTLGIRFSITPDPRKPHIHTIRIWEGMPFVNWFEDNCGRYSENKIIPRFVMFLPVDMIKHFLHIMYLGDGCGSTTRTERYLSVNKKLVDQIQELWILCGRSSSVGFMSSESRENCDGIFYAEESQRDSWIIGPEHIYLEEYNGKVYCPSTENGIICIRDNGKTLWIGNCYKSEDLITEESAPKFVRMVRDRGHHAMLEHAVASARIIGDRGLTHELVRHRLAAYAQESTRYCNYSKGKFGGEITIVRQPGFTEQQEQVYETVMKMVEACYMDLLASGAKPDAARAVLPTGLKAEIVITANLREWRWIFKMRTDRAAHPIIRKIMQEILVKFNEKIPCIFEDLTENNS